MRLIFVTFCTLCLAAPSFGQRVTQDEIRVVKEVVNGNHQVSGVYGPGWTDAEVQQLVNEECATVGRRLTVFKIKSRSKTRGTKFEGDCN